MMSNIRLIGKIAVLLTFCGYMIFYNSLGKSCAAQYLIIDKSEFTLQVWEQNAILREYPIAIGKNSGEKTCVGDMKTPTGNFSVDEILDSRTWTHDFKDGKGEIEGAYGPYFISLVTGWEGIGIHGTHLPESISTRSSEGCIRMGNDDLLELKTEYIYVGMTVLIKE